MIWLSIYLITNNKHCQLLLYVSFQLCFIFISSEINAKVFETSSKTGHNVG